MSSNGFRKQLPAWALPLAIIVGAAVLVLIGVKALTGGAPDAGPPLQVHPGMVDFRKEVEKGNVGRRR